MSLRSRNFDQEEYNSDNLSEDELVNTIPNLLYKYTTINENTIKSIKNNELWFSKPSTFNDPFDCKININFGDNFDGLLRNSSKVLGKKIEDFSSKEEWLNLFRNDIKLGNIVMNEVLHNSIEIKFGIFCLSAYCTSPLMWAHYSDSHKGICLEFEPHKTDFFVENLIPVQYYETYPDFNLDDLNSDELSKFFLHVLSSKGNDWDYEFEWRVVSRNGGNRLYKFNKRSLKSVMFGLNTPANDKNDFIQLLMKNEYKHVEFYQAKLSSNSYEIVFEKVLI